MTSIINQQFENLKSCYQSASIVPLADGSFQVTIPGITLPDGWTKSDTTIKFIVPIGYPMARPDCFWADVDLKLTNGGIPLNSNI